MKCQDRVKTRVILKRHGPHQLHKCQLPVLNSFTREHLTTTQMLKFFSKFLYFLNDCYEAGTLCGGKMLSCEAIQNRQLTFM